jgi:hypothetical protein
MMGLKNKLDALPDELLIPIITYAGILDVQPPTSLTYKGEEAVHFTPTLRHPWKVISTVCRRWQEIALPLLAQDCCISVPTRRQEPRKSPLVSKPLIILLKSIANIYKNPSYHDTMRTISGDFKGDALVKLEGEDGLLTNVPHRQMSIDLHSEAEALLAFIKRCSLARYVKTLTIHVEEVLRPFIDIHNGSPITQEMQLLWKRIFDVIDPSSITLVAAPTTMLFLVTAAGETYRHEWVFNIPYHFLEFHRDGSSSRGTEVEARRQDVDDVSKAANKLFPLHEQRPWTHLIYNEGSMIRGYSHYEWQEKRPQKLLVALLRAIHISQSRVRSPPIHSLTYISYFPYSEHVRLVANIASQIPTMAKIAVRFADTDIISNPEMLGKGQAADCWTEWAQSTRAVVREFLSKDRSRSLSFESYDEQSEEIVMLVEEEMDRWQANLWGKPEMKDWRHWVKRDGRALRWTADISLRKSGC